MEKLLLGSTKDEKRIERNGMLWNASYAMLLAFQSVILLMIIKRSCGLYEAGVFSIANANANLMYAIGKYGMRNYQVSDVKGQYVFNEYLWSRIITSSLMLLSSVAYAVYGVLKLGYTSEKFWIVVLYCVLRVIDAFEDVYAGYYQQLGRLDVAGRFMTFRLFITIIMITAILIPTNNMIVSFTVSLIVSVIVSMSFIVFTCKKLSSNRLIEKVKINRVVALLISTLPLFIAGFFALYIDNVEKYAIDAYMNEEAQACYNFVFMPAYVVTLLAGFVLQPLVTKMSHSWKDKDVSGFIRLAILQLLVILGISAVVLAGAYLLGIPVLSIVFATDLTDYKMSLMVLLLGGTGYAISAFFVTILTVIRKQGVVIIGYIISAVFARFMAKYAVVNHGVIGASVTYLISMVLLAVIFLAFIFFYIMREKKLNSNI